MAEINNTMECSVLELPEVSICCYKAGNGPLPLVLLHGGGCDNAMLSWGEVMTELAMEVPPAFTVYCYDQPGYGASSVPDVTMDIPFNLSVLEQVVDHWGLDGFVLGGISMGGSIAIGYALAHPKRLRGLVLVDSWCLNRKPKGMAFDRWYCQHFSTPKQYAWFCKHPALARWSISYALFGDKRHITGQLVDEILAACSAPGAGQAMWDFQRSSCGKDHVEPDYAARLQELAMPVLLLHGAGDKLVPLCDAQKAAAQIPGAKLEVFSRAKHWPQKEYPRLFCEKVSAWCAGLVPPNT